MPSMWTACASVRDPAVGERCLVTVGAIPRQCRVEAVATARYDEDGGRVFVGPDGAELFYYDDDGLGDGDVVYRAERE